MMPLEAQVTSLDLSKRLKELKVPQDSLWTWTLGIVEGYFLGLREIQEPDIGPNDCAAFTVAELGEIIHERFNLPVKVRKKWRENYSTSKDQATEADARALTLIYLIEQNLWKPEGK